MRPHSPDYLRSVLYPVGRPQSIEQLPTIVRTVALLRPTNTKCADMIFSYVGEMLANDRYVARVLESRAAVLDWKTLLAVLAVHPAFADAQKYYYVRDCMARFATATASGTPPAPAPATAAPPPPPPSSLLPASPVTGSGAPAAAVDPGAGAAAQAAAQAAAIGVGAGPRVRSPLYPTGPDAADPAVRPRALKSHSQELAFRNWQHLRDELPSDGDGASRDRSSSFGDRTSERRSALRPSASVPLLAHGMEQGYQVSGNGSPLHRDPGSAGGGWGTISASSSHDLGSLSTSFSNGGDSSGALESWSHKTNQVCLELTHTAKFLSALNFAAQRTRCRRWACGYAPYGCTSTMTSWRTSSSSCFCACWPPWALRRGFAVADAWFPRFALSCIAQACHGGGLDSVGRERARRAPQDAPGPAGERPDSGAHDPADSRT